MTLIKGSAGEKEAKQISEEISEQIKSLEGKVEKKDFWGKRSLAYKIREDTEGYYEVIDLELPKDHVKKLKSKLNLMDNLVRYIVTAKS